MMSGSINHDLPFKRFHTNRLETQITQATKSPCSKHLNTESLQVNTPPYSTASTWDLYAVSRELYWQMSVALPSVFTRANNLRACLDQIPLVIKSRHKTVLESQLYTGLANS